MKTTMTRSWQTTTMMTVLMMSVELATAFGAGGYVGSLFNRVQKNLLDSWDLMRDRQLRPRLFASLKLDGNPTFVQTVESNRGQIDLAVNFLDSNNGEVSLRRISDVTGWLRNRGNVTLQDTGRRFGWANSVGKVDGDLMPDINEPYWWVTSNYYPREGTEGQIVLLPISNTSSAPIHLSPDEPHSNWFYSMVDWVDMNLDGWPDLVTSRSQGEKGSIQVTELIWLENPGYRSLMQVLQSHRRWRCHQITKGPDVSFRILRIPLPSGESRMVIIGAGYWDNKLYAVWTEDPEENWSNLDAINERVIDNHGWFYDLQIADINADGRDDILVTTWSYNLQQGSVIVYEIPCDFTRDKWPRHTLLDGTVNLKRPDMGSGGKINVFHPIVRDGHLSRRKKPHIIVSGDNDGKVYVLIPDSKKTSVWTYSTQTIFQVRGAVGAIAVDDMNHDGFTEVVIPAYDARRLLFFTYEPAAVDHHYFVDHATRARGGLEQYVSRLDLDTT